MSSSRVVKDLVDICQDQLRKRVIGKIETVLVLEVANELNLAELRADCLRTIRFKYEFFKEITEEAYLKDLIGDEETVHMERASIDRNKFKRYIRQEGTVLEQQAAPTVAEHLPAYDMDGNRNVFPVEALLGGVKWPAGIDPAKREEWLSDGDFENLFKMSKEQFRTIGRFQKERLKKDVKLW
jgi:hypothetical protein